MPLPRGLARFNRSVTNRITKSAAARLGGFGYSITTGVGAEMSMRRRSTPGDKARR